MIKLRDIMSEGKYAASEADMKKWFDECMRKYFPQYVSKITRPFRTIPKTGIAEQYIDPDWKDNWVYPDLQVKSLKGRGSTGICQTSRIKRNGQIVMPIIAVSPEYIKTDGRSIVFHETIHYVQAYTYTPIEHKYMSNGGHDSFFKEMMNKMNAVEGENYITIEYDQTTKSDSETIGTNLWVYLFVKDGKWGAASFSRKSPKTVEFFKYFLKNGRYTEAYEMLSDKLKYVGGGWQGRNFSYNLLSVPPTQDELAGAREIIVDPY